MIAARNPENLRKVQQEIAEYGAESEMIPTDITDEKQVIKLFSETMNRFNRLDVLVNNAMANDVSTIDTTSTEVWDTIIAVNLRAPFMCTREAFRIMKRQGGGRIINIGSISAQRVREGSAPYSSAKYGVVGLTYVTALEGREFGITCGCLHPGNTFTEGRMATMANSKDDEPIMSVDEIAAAAIYMAKQPQHINVLEMIQLPAKQLYIGRG